MSPRNQSKRSARKISARVLDEGEEVNNLLIDAIKAKLAILDNIGGQQ